MLKALYLSELKSLMRDRAQMLFIIIGPLFFVFIFGSGFRAEAKPLRIAVVSTSEDAVSRQFVKALSADRELEISKSPSEKQARMRFESGKIDGAIIVPNLGSGGRVVLLFDEKSPEKIQRATAHASAVTQSFNLMLAGAKQTVGLKVKGLRANKKVGSFNFALPTIIMFGIIFTSLGGVTARLVNYRQQGLLKRLMVTPLTPQILVISEVLSRIVVALFQTTLVLVAGSVFYHAKLGINVVWVYGLAVTATVMFSCIGVSLAANQRTAESAQGIAGFASTLLIFTTGSFAEIFPPVVSKVASYFPLAPVIKTMRGVILDGAPGFGLNTDTYLIAAWLIVPTFLALKTFSFREPIKKAKNNSASRRVRGAELREE
ncbi:MAG: ABC transporter permease [Actinomycetota bacterium]|nr:ABC transporter permease [Actinomycetota bacterium]